MADRMTREQRHLCMSHIRGKNTSPEMLVRKALFAAGFRFRVNVSSLPGTPDIVLRKYDTAVFVNGCFWHGHKDCRHYVVPKTNVKFWQEKVARNRRRDAAVTLRLQSRGWKVITVWECELDPSHRAETISSLIDQIKKNGEEYSAELAAKKSRSARLRQEKELAEARNRTLNEEIYSRYHVPHRIRKEAAKLEDVDQSDIK